VPLKDFFKSSIMSSGNQGKIDNDACPSFANPDACKWPSYFVPRLSPRHSQRKDYAETSKKYSDEEQIDEDQIDDDDANAVHSNRDDSEDESYEHEQKNDTQIFT
jgi:hypothetical protein